MPGGLSPGVLEGGWGLWGGLGWKLQRIRDTRGTGGDMNQIRTIK